MPKSGRNWESTCGDCTHMKDGYCEESFVGTDANDPIAAVCRSFQDKWKAEQNYKRDEVE